MLQGFNAREPPRVIPIRPIAGKARSRELTQRQAGLVSRAYPGKPEGECKAFKTPQSTQRYG